MIWCKQLCRLLINNWFKLLIERDVSGFTCVLLIGTLQLFHCGKRLSLDILTTLDGLRSNCERCLLSLKNSFLELGNLFLAIRVLFRGLAFNCWFYVSLLRQLMPFTQVIISKSSFIVLSGTVTKLLSVLTITLTTPFKIIVLTAIVICLNFVLQLLDSLGATILVCHQETVVG